MIASDVVTLLAITHLCLDNGYRLSCIELYNLFTLQLGSPISPQHMRPCHWLLTLYLLCSSTPALIPTHLTTQTVFLNWNHNSTFSYLLLVLASPHTPVFNKDYKVKGESVGNYFFIFIFGSYQVSCMSCSFHGSFNTLIPLHYTNSRRYKTSQNLFLLKCENRKPML